MNRRLLDNAIYNALCWAMAFVIVCAGTLAVALAIFFVALLVSFK